MQSPVDLEALILLHADGYLTDVSSDLSGKFSFFTRDADVLAAKKRVAARRSAAAAKKKATPPSSGTGGGKPPEPPQVWLKSGGGDDEIRRKHFQDLATADRTVPIDHIVKGKVRRNRIHGAHDYERLEWIREKVSEGIEISHNGKTLFPNLRGKTEALEKWLGDGNRGVISEVLSEPDEIHLVTRNQRELRKAVMTPDGHRITMIVHIGPTKQSESSSFRIATAYPQRGGEGVLDEEIYLRG